MEQNNEKPFANIGMHSTYAWLACAFVCISTYFDHLEYKNPGDDLFMSISILGSIAELILWIYITHELKENQDGVMTDAFRTLIIFI